MSVCNACQPPYIYLGVSPGGDGERDVVGRWPRLPPPDRDVRAPRKKNKGVRAFRFFPLLSLLLLPVAAPPHGSLISFT